MPRKKKPGAPAAPSRPSPNPAGRPPDATEPSYLEGIRRGAPPAAIAQVCRRAILMASLPMNKEGTEIDWAGVTRKMELRARYAMNWLGKYVVGPAVRAESGDLDVEVAQSPRSVRLVVRQATDGEVVEIRKATNKGSGTNGNGSSTTGNGASTTGNGAFAEGSG